MSTRLRAAFEQALSDQDTNGLAIRCAGNAHRQRLLDFTANGVARLVIAPEDGGTQLLRNRLMNTQAAPPIFLRMLGQYSAPSIEEWVCR